MIPVQRATFKGLWIRSYSRAQMWAPPIVHIYLGWKGVLDTFDDYIGTRGPLYSEMGTSR